VPEPDRSTVPVANATLVLNWVMVMVMLWVVPSTSEMENWRSCAVSVRVQEVGIGGKSSNPPSLPAQGVELKSSPPCTVNGSSEGSANRSESGAPVVVMRFPVNGTGAADDELDGVSISIVTPPMATPSSGKSCDMPLAH